jgi:hypothetical protein
MIPDIWWPNVIGPLLRVGIPFRKGIFEGVIPQAFTCIKASLDAIFGITTPHFSEVHLLCRNVQSSFENLFKEIIAIPAL